KSAEVGVDGLARALASAFSVADVANIGGAIGASLRADGTEAIGNALQESLAQAIEGVSAELDDPEGMIAGYGLALGEAVGGNIGAAVGTAVGTAIGAALGGPLGATVGSAIGNAIGTIGDALFGSSQKRARFNFGDLETLLGRKPSVDADFFRGWFGDVAFGSKIGR